MFLKRRDLLKFTSLDDFEAELQNGNQKDKKLVQSAIAYALAEGIAQKREIAEHLSTPEEIVSAYMVRKWERGDGAPHESLRVVLIRWLLEKISELRRSAA